MSKIITTPHDRMFRAALKNIQVAREYFETYLPKEILQSINLNVLEPCPEIYVNEYLKLSESDVIYKTEAAGETSYLLAAEHETKGSALMPFRVLKYDVAIWQFHLDQNPKAQKLPLIINIVYYTGQKPYAYSTDFKDLLDAPKALVDAFWAKPFTLVQAQDIPDDELLRQKWAGLFMYFMKHIRADDLLPHLSAVLPLMKAIDAKNGVKYLEAVSHYALAAGEISDAKKFVELLKSELSADTGEKIMTGAQQLIELGKLEGIQQGIQQGALNEERTILMRLLTRRFGSVSSHYIQKIESASTDSLLHWIDKVLDAKNVEEVFNFYR